MTSPTQRTLKRLRDDGWVAVVVEKWNPWTKQRKDVFGADILAVKIGERSPLLVQCTSASNHSARIHKLKETQGVKEWLSCGGRMEVHSWGKRGPRGKRKVWTRKVTELTLEDLEAGEG